MDKEPIYQPGFYNTGYASQQLYFRNPKKEIRVLIISLSEFFGSCLVILVVGQSNSTSFKVHCTSVMANALQILYKQEVLETQG